VKVGRLQQFFCGKVRISVKNYEQVTSFFSSFPSSLYLLLIGRNKEPRVQFCSQFFTSLNLCFPSSEIIFHSRHQQPNNYRNPINPPNTPTLIYSRRIQQQAGLKKSAFFILNPIKGVPTTLHVFNCIYLSTGDCTFIPSLEVP
jgi:hypothetical protein